VKHGKMNMPIECHGVTWGWVEAPTNQDGKVNSYIHKKLLVAGYGSSDVRAATIDANGNVTKLETVFKAGFAPSNVMRVTQGPDGAFYVGVGAACCAFQDNIGSGAVFKFSYKGSCLVPPKAVSVRQTYARFAQPGSGRYMLAHIGPTQIDVPAGISRIEAYDVAGKKVWSSSRTAAPSMTKEFIPASVPRGMLELRYFEN